MTNIEILEKRAEELYNQKYRLEDRLNKLYDRKKQQKKIVLDKYLTSDIPEGYDIFILTGERVELRKKGSTNSIVTAYFYDCWEEDGRMIEKIELSLYSFRAEVSGNWISEYFEAISKFAITVEDVNDDLIAELNRIESRYYKFEQSFRPYFKDINKSISDQNKDIKILEKKKLMEELFDEDGISLTPEKDDNWLPRFEVKWDWEISNVAGLRAVKKSASGKSVDLEIKTRFRDWNSNDWKIETLKAERVRFDKVELFLNRNKKYIV